MTSGADRYLARKQAGGAITIVTPEGVPLEFTIASAGDRAAAFLLDAGVILLVLVVLGLLAMSAATGGHLSGWLGALLQLVAFFLTTFYWIWFEMRWQGSSPGKRWTGIRVMDRKGGPLTAEAVFARNLVRDLEAWMPLAFLVAPEAMWPDAPPWARLAAGAWLLVFAFFPLFNKERLRVGDLVAGTMVVVAPRAVLLPDQIVAPATAYRFTDEQLDVYGIYELKVLETVLRQADSGGIEHAVALGAVCEKIKTKIRWESADWNVDAERFLRDFYAALRARLEHRMLLGDRKADKYAR
jgi:uncharacterized RDD family membrane protein YckC